MLPVRVVDYDLWEYTLKLLSSLTDKCPEDIQSTYLSCGQQGRHYTLIIAGKP